MLRALKLAHELAAELLELPLWPIQLLLGFGGLQRLPFVLVASIELSVVVVAASLPVAAMGIVPAHLPPREEVSLDSQLHQLVPNQKLEVLLQGLQQLERLQKLYLLHAACFVEAGPESVRTNSESLVLLLTEHVAAAQPTR